MSCPDDIVLLSFYELGRQPLGLAQAAGFLLRAGLSARCFDLAVRPLDAEVLDACAGARLVGLSVPMHTALRLAQEALPRLRQVAPSAHLCAFGLYAPLHAPALQAAGVDTLLGGEHEEELVTLARSLVALASGPDPSPNPSRARARTPGSAPLISLRRLCYPVPSRAGLPPLSAYARLIAADGTERLAGAVEATRGCLHTCRHCPIPAVYQGRFFAIPADVVLADAAQQVAAGARHLSFADADFFNGPRHAVAIARALHAAHPEVTFDVTIKVEHILRHRDLLPELARAGCLFIVSAVESLADAVLAILDKGHTSAEVVPALRAVRACGMSLRPTFLPFTPWTTATDYLALVHFVFEHDLLAEVEPVQLSLRLLVPPGSLLLDRPELAPHLGPLDARALTHVWRNPDPRLDALQEELQALVEQAAAATETAEETFDRIHDLATGALLGAGSQARRPPRPARRSPVAHLSEPWFC